MNLDIARWWLKQRLYAYGMRAGIPYPVLRSAANLSDAAGHPLDAWRRRALARRVIVGFAKTGFGGWRCAWRLR
jgi:hypothetical protein